MSLQVYFFTKETNITDIEFENFAADVYEKKQHNGEAHYIYRNPNTGVNFKLIRGRKLPEGTDFPGHSYAGIVAEIDYLRGTHFPVEASSELIALSEQFGVFAYMPQSDYRIPKVFSYKEFIEVWDKDNATEIAKNQEGLNRDYFVLPQEKILYNQTWYLEKVLLMKELLDDSPDNLMLDPFVLKPQLSEVCVTATQLEDDALVIPNVDFVIIKIGRSSKVVLMDDFSREVGNTLSYPVGDYQHRLYNPKKGDFEKFSQYPRELNTFFRVPMEKLIDLEYFIQQ
jgi:hypothetical protein